MTRLPDWYVRVLGDDLRQRRLARAELAQVASSAWAAVGISATCPSGATDLVVRGRTGRHQQAATIDDLLDAFEHLAGRPYDPLYHPDLPVAQRVEPAPLDLQP